jgi:hypothetical protein
MDSPPSAASLQQFHRLLLHLLIGFLGQAVQLQPKAAERIDPDRPRPKLCMLALARRRQLPATDDTDGISPPDVRVQRLGTEGREVLPVKEMGADEALHLVQLERHLEDPARPLAPTALQGKVGEGQTPHEVADTAAGGKGPLADRRQVAKCLGAPTQGIRRLDCRINRTNPAPPRTTMLDTLRGQLEYAPVPDGSAIADAAKQGLPDKDAPIPAAARGTRRGLWATSPTSPRIESADLNRPIEPYVAKASRFSLGVGRIRYGVGLPFSEAFRTCLTEFEGA